MGGGLHVVLLGLGRVQLGFGHHPFFPSVHRASLQVPEAAGTFELQIRFVRNEKGVLADGRCCRGGLEPPCPVTDQCQTFFRACLKEYQLRALPGGPCVLGTATTPVLGGNIFSTAHRKGLDSAHKMVVRFDFAWPVRDSPSPRFFGLVGGEGAVTSERVGSLKAA